METLGDSATNPSPTHPLSRSLEPNIGQLTTNNEESVSTGNLSDIKESHFTAPNNLSNEPDQTYEDNVKIEEPLASTKKDTPSEENLELAVEANVPQKESNSENETPVSIADIDPTLLFNRNSDNILIKSSLDKRDDKEESTSNILVETRTSTRNNLSKIAFESVSIESLQIEIKKRNEEIERLNSMNKNLLEKVKRQNEEAVIFKNTIMDLNVSNENTPVKGSGTKKGKSSKKCKYEDRCNRKSECKFRHPRRVCYEYVESRSCRWREKCKFRHPGQRKKTKQYQNQNTAPQQPQRLDQTQSQ